MIEQDEPVRFVFDSGALIQLERGNAVIRDVLSRAAEGTVEIIIPRTVLAEVWRGGPRQTRLATLLKIAEDAPEQPASVRIDELSSRRARDIGAAIGACGHGDIVDVNVALCARDPNGMVDAVMVTADRDDIVRVDSSLERVILDV